MIYLKNMWRVREYLKSKFFSEKILIKKKIDFGSHKANSFFLRMLKNSKFYFEYGAGSSTFEAKKMITGKQNNKKNFNEQPGINTYIMCHRETRYPSNYKSWKHYTFI